MAIFFHEKHNGKHWEAESQRSIGLTEVSHGDKQSDSSTEYAEPWLLCHGSTQFRHLLRTAWVERL